MENGGIVKKQRQTHGQEQCRDCWVGGGKRGRRGSGGINGDGWRLDLGR